VRREEGENTFHFYVKEDVRSLDPILSSDIYAQQIVSQMYEGLLHFHYLKRPLTLEPLLAEQLPQISADGLVYRFQIKKGIYFHEDPVFKGKKRELVAEDFIYSWKRLADPKNKSENYWALQDKIKGLDEWRDLMSSNGATYDSPVEGLRAPERYVLEVHLKQKNFQFLYILALGITAVVPREAVEFYGSDFNIHPVGTGPFFLESWLRGSRIQLGKNKEYHLQLYPSEGAVGDVEKDLLVDSGKKLPFIDKIVIDEIAQEQPQWLLFLKGALDILLVPKDYVPVFVKNGKLAPEYEKKRMALQLAPNMDTTYIGFNTENRFLKNKKIRQAMSLAYDASLSLEKFYSGLSIHAHGPIPPQLDGYRAAYKNPYSQLDLKLAKKLLVEAGFPGGRGLPNFTFDIGTTNSTSRQMAEFFQQRMALLGIKIKISINSWPAFNDKVRKKRTELFEMAWNADYPDADNFFQLFYGRNISPGPNGANFQNRKFDDLFEKARDLPPGSERTGIYEKMEEVLADEAPWIFLFHRVRVVGLQAWVKNYKHEAMIMDAMKYYRIDSDLKKALN
jgi:ABC-type transport system substrate-binding protein